MCKILTLKATPKQKIWIDKLEHDGCFEDGEWIQVYENAFIAIK